MNLTAIFAVFLLVLTSGWAVEEHSIAEPDVSQTAPIQSIGETNHAAQSIFDDDNDDDSGAENGLANQPTASSAKSISREEIASPLVSSKEELEESPVEQSTVPLPNDPEPEMPTTTLNSEPVQSSESKPFTAENEMPNREEVVGDSDDDAEYLSLEELRLINEIVQQIPSPPSDSPTSSATLEAKAEKVLELINQNESASLESSPPLDEALVQHAIASSTDDLSQLENTVDELLPSSQNPSSSDSNSDLSKSSPVISSEPKSDHTTAQSPEDALKSQTTATFPPELISLGAINLNLLPPFADPSIRQYQLNMSLPLLDQLELSVTLQELYQGQVEAVGTGQQQLLYETIYQLGLLSGSVPSIAQGHLSLLSGTLTVTSSEAIQLETLSSSSSSFDSWRDLQFQLQQASSNLLFVGKLAKSGSPSSDGAISYRCEVSFSVGPVSGRYHLRLEKQQQPQPGQQPVGKQQQQPCPWISLDHELTTTPEDVLYFHSFIDHICNGSAAPANSEDSQMNIEIVLKSALWPLANFNLNQTFNFGTAGDELMHASHPLFDIAVDGFWNSDSIYSKRLKIHPSAIGAHFLPFVPSNLKAIFTRIQQTDGLSKAYTLNIERSPELTSQASQQGQVALSERLSLSLLVVKITSAFISATTIVFSANGALFSEFVSLFELFFDSLFATIEEPYFVYFDLHQFQFAFELTAFVLVFLLVYMLLSFVDLVDTVIRIVLIVLFVEICVATIGVQLISLGYM